jgi:cytochrome c-type biogenesis protein CcmH
LSLFVVVCAALVVIALVFALPPFLRPPRPAPGTDRREANLDLYREQSADLDRDLAAGNVSREQYERDRQELSRRMLEDVRPDAEPGATTGTGTMARLAPGIAIAAVFPIAAVLIYAQIGAPGALDPAVRSAAPAHAGREFTPEQVEELVAKLAQRMEQEPDKLEGWVLLGRTYSAMGRFPEAAKALQRSLQLQPDEPDLLADYADVLAMTNGQTLEGEPTRLLERALALDPEHQKSLALAGTAAYARADYARAVAYWERLLKTLPADSEDLRSIQASIDEARTQAGNKAPKVAQSPPATGAAKPPAASGTSPPATSPGTIAGKVSLSRALTAKAAPDDTLFVYVRAPDGPPMPIAIQRLQVKDMPAQFKLDDSMAMAPDRRLSNFPQVVVIARVSKSGKAAPQSGDLEGSIGPVKVGGPALEVLIDKVRP